MELTKLPSLTQNLFMHEYLFAQNIIPPRRTSGTVNTTQTKMTVLMNVLDGAHQTSTSYDEASLCMNICLPKIQYSYIIQLVIMNTIQSKTTVLMNVLNGAHQTSTSYSKSLCMNIYLHMI